MLCYALCCLDAGRLCHIDVDATVVVDCCSSNKPNPAQIIDRLNSVDGSHTCESCYGERYLAIVNFLFAGCHT